MNLNRILKGWTDGRISSGICLFLITGTLWAFWPATKSNFIDYDDDLYVTQNPQVQAGLAFGSIRWAFITGHAANWHPLTWLSLMLDAELFGKNAAAFHLTNLVLHAANSVLLFLLFWRLTGAKWRSAMVAALFAWHPLHVESVVWVSERKDVLCAFFGFLTLIFYAYYAWGAEAKGQRLEARITVFHSSFCYYFALFCFALGLMSKPMLVTWPFVMLLLDYWPLDRWRPGESWPLVREKIPFVVLVLAASLVTFFVQRSGGALAAWNHRPMDMRLENALISYCRYLGKLFWPSNLAVIYPYPGYWLLSQVVVAGILLAGLSVLFWFERRHHPFLWIGWLWYVSTLVPVIGVVQVGEQALADRYTYIPSVGVSLMIVWGASELTRRLRHQMMTLRFAGSLMIVLCLVLTRHQLGYWQDSEVLFRHAIAITNNNFVAHDNLGFALYEKGQTNAALNEFQEAVRLQSTDANGQFNLGVILAMQGHTDAAIYQIQKALDLNPNFAVRHDILGKLLEERGRTNAAMKQFYEALRFQPDDVKAHHALGALFSARGQIDEAISEYQEILRLQPDDVKASYALGALILVKGHIGQLQEVLRLHPDDAEAHDTLGMALADKGDSGRAIMEFQRAIKLRPDYALAFNNLGYLWVERGEHLDEARQLIAKAIQLEPKNSDYLDSMGCLLLKQNQPSAALNYLLNAIENAPRPDASVYDHLGDAYTALGQQGLAAQAWGKSLELAPAPQVQKKLSGLSAP